MSSNRFASYSFLFGCDFCENIQDCPFTKLCRLAIEERVHRLKKMTYQEITNLEYIHKKCLKKRKHLKKEKYLIYG